MSFSENEDKSAVIEKYRLHGTDTGSPEVQIALLTDRLGNLTKHFQKHPQDIHSKKGLFAAVSKRKRLLNYLKSQNVQRYRDALDRFGLRK